MSYTFCETFDLQVFDLHRHNIDHITIPSSRGPEYGVLRRVDDVSLHKLGYTAVNVLATWGNKLVVYCWSFSLLFQVFDCWFESGSMPYAYLHYPFENVELFEKNFPGHFVAEGLDQTRGWYVFRDILVLFHMLHSISLLRQASSAFKHFWFQSNVPLYIFPNCHWFIFLVLALTCIIFSFRYQNLSFFWVLTTFIQIM